MPPPNMTPTSAGTVSPSDVLTTLKNLVTAINSAAQTYLGVQGVSNSGSLKATTQIAAGPGRVCTVIVTTAGAAGAIYDSADATATSNPIFVVPATLGIYVLNMPVRYGIVYAPGSAQVAVVSYS